MKIPLSWLKEFIALDLSAEEIADKLTLAGLEVDKIEKTPFTFTGVVVGKVIAVVPHPDADKLQVAQVSDGKEEFQVVCGASNCRQGLITAFAKIGATLQDEQSRSFKIKKGKLRGVESYGMLCSEEELGLALKSGGIAELPENLNLGSDLRIAFTDTLFEISLTPNLGHCMSLLGVARELAAQLDTNCISPKLPQEKTVETLPIKVDTPDLCPRYCAKLIRNVKVGPSPDWLQKRLEACGIRSLNNIVDVTNYIMLELGQPMHAFDFGKIAGGTIHVKTSSKEEKLKTLDNQLRTIPSGTLLIRDGEKPIAIAGVMGGEELGCHR